jgi:hypothetical protein
MGIGGYLATLLISTIAAWAGWAAVLYRVNPEEAGLPGLAMFYITLAVALFGTLTLLGTLIRLKARGGQAPVVAREVKIAFRHAAILTSASIALLLLAAADRLGWIGFLLVGLAALGLEGAVLALQVGKRG